ncbi:hypothetical protein B0T26DRAFT_715584 [Lasiosphaeria miniovina]|uniref:Uncharacterized protein n=1 Tax=Lasiosphaeria miniovina TaxID=1954250 RepID=A0AA40ABN3_9PEZI|nr:uncharacterized protein B0T26DRAFT_715584 [Lasiosphaeria miniovina]KAK0712886.1 hypothetical protein B0T26DRAFT_715584 [Lasiosphaeria miniovina]
MAQLDGWGIYIYIYLFPLQPSILFCYYHQQHWKKIIIETPSSWWPSRYDQSFYGGHAFCVLLAIYVMTRGGLGKEGNEIFTGMIYIRGGRWFRVLFLFSHGAGCVVFRYGGEIFYFLSIDIPSPGLACLPALWGSLFTDIKAVMDGTHAGKLCYLFGSCCLCGCVVWKPLKIGKKKEG